MPKYEVNLMLYQPKTLEVWARNESEAKEKALNIVLGWQSVDDAEVEDCSEL